MIIEYEYTTQGITTHYAALCELIETDNGQDNEQEATLSSSIPVRLMRLMGQVSEVIIPEDINGYRVRSIGEYCFAEKCNCKNRTFETEWEELGRIADAEGLHELSGSYIQSVSLPDSVEVLESYAFYNCRKLKSIEFGKKLNTVNNDAFMNCRGLDILAVRSDVNEPTGVKYFLKQLNKGIDLQFINGEKNILGSFYYSEYTESYEEIGPAHIFQLDMEGEGYRARQLFNGGVIDVSGYDGIFEAAGALESVYTMSHMAIGRLRFPVALSRESADIYRSYLKDNIMDILNWVVREKRLDIVTFFSNENVLGEKGLEMAVKLAAEAGWTAGTAGIIELGSNIAGSIKKSRYEF